MTYTVRRGFTANKYGEQVGMKVEDILLTDEETPKGPRGFH